jgi:hypothetical protein
VVEPNQTCGECPFDSTLDGIIGGREHHPDFVALHQPAGNRIAALHVAIDHADLAHIAAGDRDICTIDCP